MAKKEIKVTAYTVFRQAILLRKSQYTPLYKIVINYCVIKMQIVIILSKMLNIALSVNILQFSKQFQLIIDKCQQTINQNWRVCLFIICRVVKFFFLIPLRETTLISKARTSNRKSRRFC